MGRSDNIELTLTLRCCRVSAATESRPSPHCSLFLSDLFTHLDYLSWSCGCLFLNFGLGGLHLFLLAQLSSSFRYSTKPQFYPSVKSWSDQMLISFFRFWVFFLWDLMLGKKLSLFSRLVLFCFFFLCCVRLLYSYQLFIIALENFMC